MPPKPLKLGDPPRLGRFEILARLGDGGQGVVYLGRGTGPEEERVAVKVLRSSVDAMVLQRLARELDAIHQVQPFVTARVIDASAEGDQRFVVSEFIDGPSLQERVDVNGPMPEGDLQRLAVGTATALAAIHGAGVVHRDFKPANVLLGPDGPRVVDFGIARLVDATTITSGLIGTPCYVAPEQLEGERPGSAVDVFAWAVTMVFAATGRSAFGSDSVPAVMHRILNEQPDLGGVPPSLLPVIRQCLDKDPRRRPSARDLLLRLVDPSAQGSGPTIADAASLTSTAPVGPAPAMAEPAFSGGLPARPPGTGPARFRRAPILAACAVAAAAVLAVTGTLLLTSRSPGTTGQATNTASQAADTRSSPATGGGPTAADQAASATIPSSWAGTWTGTAKMAAIGNPGISLDNTITFIFAAGARTAHEVDQDCTNTLALSKVTANVLTFSEPQTLSCEAGTVTFTRHGTGLAYRWTDINKLEQNTATLHRRA